jgi:hypothetical protein
MPPRTRTSGAAANATATTPPAVDVASPTLGESAPANADGVAELEVAPVAGDAEFDALKPRMTRAEQRLLVSIASARKSVVEFGCGGSTLKWIQSGCERVVSVESDAAWVDRLAGHPELVEPIDAGRLTLVKADIGPTGAWGRPIGWRNVAQWADYWSTVWDLPVVRDAPSLVDTVLVDGRFRVASALNAALQTNPGTLVLVHDFWKRPQYQPILEHLTPIATADQLVVLQRRPDFSLPEVVQTLAKHVADTR